MTFRHLTLRGLSLRQGLLTGLSSLLIANPSSAEELPPVIEEIVVTAEFRANTVNRTPASDNLA